LLREAEVRMAKARTESRQRSGSRVSCVSMAGEEREKLKVDGIEFEVCPMIVVQRGYAI
jgi:hypothetical protein